MTDEPEHGPPSRDEILRMTCEIVASFVSNNPVSAEALPDVIHSVFKAVSGLSSPADVRADERPRPAVPVSKSVTNDYIICLEDGRKLKMLKRYLRARYDMSPEDYRRRWGLPADYPMVAPSYTVRRSEFAKAIGLGRTSKGG
jgi:predicted transcriptional regulator